MSFSASIAETWFSTNFGQKDGRESISFSKETQWVSFSIEIDHWETIAQPPSETKNMKIVNNSIHKIECYNDIKH